MKNKLLYSIVILIVLRLAACAAPATSVAIPTASYVSPTVAPTATATQVPMPTPRPEPALYVLSKSGSVTRISLAGDKQTIIQGVSGYGLRVTEDNIYAANPTHTQILVYDLHGTLLQTIQLFTKADFLEFTTLPNGGFALLSNYSDKVYLTDSSGALVATVDMLKQKDDHAQNVSAVVTNGSLIVSEDGKNHVLAIDLQTYKASVFANLPTLRPWLGAITYGDGKYYLATSDTIYNISSDSPPIKLAKIPSNNIAGMAFLDHSIYVSVNFTGEVYKVNPSDGSFALLVSGLDYPQNLEVNP